MRHDRKMLRLGAVAVVSLLLARCASAPRVADVAPPAVKPAAERKPKGKDDAYVREHYVKREYQVPMRDGVRLFTAVYSPRDTSQQYPMMLFRTPYSVGPYGEDAYNARYGYGYDPYDNRYPDGDRGLYRSGRDRDPRITGGTYDPYYRDRGNYSPAYQRGYRDGLEKGRDDGNDGDRYDPNRHGWYRSADRGYDDDYGRKEDYRVVYRQGFEAGYAEGYRVYSRR